MDAVVRLALGPLHMPKRAYLVVRKTRSAEAAKNLAEHCLQTRDFEVGCGGEARVLRWVVWGSKVAEVGCGGEAKMVGF